MNKGYWSNCLIEAIKAKIKWGNKIKIIYISPRKNDIFCPHFMWYDVLAGNVKDFTADPGFANKWYSNILFKGHIRVRPYAVYERWLKSGR